METNNNNNDIEGLNLEVVNLPNSPNENNQNIETEGTLITRIIAPKPLNLNAFKSTILRAWNITGKISANSLGDNMMAFIFSEEKDLEKVMNLSWTFRDHQLVIARWPPDKSLAEINLHKTIFWVHFFGVQVKFINQENAEKMGNEIGTFIKTDLHSSAQRWKKSLRIQVEIDVTKPLSSSLMFALTDQRKIPLEIRLNDFCHTCGKIGHKSKFCGDRKELSNEGHSSGGNFGPWMKFENQLVRNTNFERHFNVGSEIGGLEKDRNSGIKLSEIGILAGKWRETETKGGGTSATPKNWMNSGVNITDTTAHVVQLQTVDNPISFLQKENLEENQQKMSDKIPLLLKKQICLKRM
ncbi:hypothetical protein CASFOL_005787 [Castilleja foliolosa]|uniref:CCHC-type domain-containing protein n=1 Tax=Castilleja foliolosa TaxID=1961234 RepID=A0ABD3E8H3_9LAMI